MFQNCIRVLPLIAVSAFAAETFTMTPLPGVFHDIAIGGDTFWALRDGAANSYSIVHLNKSTNAWEPVPGVAARVAVEPGGTPWVINADSSIWRRNPQAAGGWEQKPGQATEISIGADGTVWVIGGTSWQGDNSIYRWDGTNWNQVSGSGRQIAAGGPGVVWVLTSDGKPWAYNPSAAGSWDAKPGNLKGIAVGEKGDVLGIDSATTHVVRWDAGGWRTATDAANIGAMRLAVNVVGRPWIVNNANSLYYPKPALPAPGSRHMSESPDLFNKKPVCSNILVPTCCGVALNTPCSCVCPSTP